MALINSGNLPEWYQQLCPVIEVTDDCPIAGSFALWLWQTHCTGKAPSWKPTDVDFWFSTEVAMLRTAIAVFLKVQKNEFLYPGATLVKRGPAIIEIQLPDLPTLQFIHRNTFKTRPPPFCFLDLFDLSVAQVAIVRFDVRSATEVKVKFDFGDDEVRNDIATGMNRCFRDMSALPEATGMQMTRKRLSKYEERGFQTHQGEIRPLKKWDVYYCDKKE